MFIQPELDLLHLKHYYLWLPGKIDAWPLSVQSRPPSLRFTEVFTTFDVSRLRTPPSTCSDLPRGEWLPLNDFLLPRRQWANSEWPEFGPLEKRGNCIRFPQRGASLLLGLGPVSLGRRGRVEERVRNTSKQSDFLSSPSSSLTCDLLSRTNISSVRSGHKSGW